MGYQVTLLLSPSDRPQGHVPAIRKPDGIPDFEMRILMNLRIKASSIFLGSCMVMGLASNAFASLTTFQAYSGNVGVSVNGGGSILDSLPNGLTAEVPAGSQVIAAYLYTSTYGTVGATAGNPAPSSYAGGSFNGNTVTYTALPPNTDSTYLQAGRADVTSIVQSVINPGSAAATGGVYNFAVTESNTNNQDGEILVAVYTNPSLPTTSIGILDGGSASGGDTSSINFASNPSGSQLLMSVGDGFSYDLGGVTNQFSTITVDGSLLTAAAGNCDDSQDGGTPPNATACFNGDLITAGNIGLNSDGSVNTSYSNPFTTVGETNVANDHELYNISSLIDPAAGNTITLNTANSSFNDNIFLEVFDASGLAGFNAPPPPPSGPPTTSPIPEPGTLSLLSIGASGLGMILRRRRIA